MSDYNDTALQILEAAKYLFSEQGFKATSTKKIAQTAPVNEVIIFRLFGSKGKLFDAVIEEFFRPNFNLLLQVKEAPLPEFLLSSPSKVLAVKNSYFLFYGFFCVST